MLINGQNREYDFSDNSNCSVKELKKTDVIFINSDSNSSMPESLNPGDHFEVSNDASDAMQPKKRGRKKGSKNHKNLVIAAEESFTNKMAVSRNSKVKTTQELLADIQNRKPSTQDIELRTAQLTESLSRIEHKLNPQKTINKNVTPIKSDGKLVNRTDGVSGPSSPEPITLASDDEIVDVVGTDPPATIFKQEQFDDSQPPPLLNEPLTIENLLQQLPIVDKSCLEEPDEIPLCVCPTPKVTEINHQLLEQQHQQQQERITVQIVGDTTETVTKENSLFAPPSPVTSPASTPVSSVIVSDVPPPSSTCDDFDDERTSVKSVDNDDNIFSENLLCPAKLFLSEKYHLDAVSDENVSELHEKHLPNVNGNFGAAQTQQQPKIVENIVPNFMSERLNKTPNENFQKYSISINDCDDGDALNNRRNSCDSDSEKIRTETTENTEFREWHETLDVISYNDELLRILPYVIID